MLSKARYSLWLRATPGGMMVRISGHDHLPNAREAARLLRDTREWLGHQDVRIEGKDGELIEYAGPKRS